MARHGLPTAADRVLLSARRPDQEIYVMNADGTSQSP